MSVARAVGRQLARLVAGAVFARMLDVGLYLLLARALGVEAFGRYTFALSFTLLFNALGDLGISTVFTREVAREPERARELLVPCLAVKLALAAVTVPAVFVAARLGPAGPDSLALVLPIVAGMLLNSTAMLFDGLLRAAGRAGRSGLNLTVQSIAALVAGCALLGAGVGALAGAYAYLAGGILRLLSAAWWSRDQWGARPPAGAPHSLRDARALLREAAPLALSSIFIALYFRIDAVILRSLQGERSVGLYAGIYRMFETFAVLAASFRSVLFPVMSRAADDPGRSLGVLCRKSLRVHLLFTIGVAVFFTCEAPVIVRVVLGAAYAAAAPGLAILMWALPGAYMADTLLFLLAAQRRQSLTTRAVGATAMFNVILNLALVPRFSFLGSSAATVASEWLSFALMFAMFRRAAPVPGMAAVAWRPGIAGAALGLGLVAIAPWTHGWPGLAGAAAASAIAYPLLLLLCGAIGREDLELVRSLVPGRPLRPADEPGR